MAMSNYWIEGEADGRKTPLRFGAGPGKEHGISLSLRMRDRGESVEAARIEGYARADGTLTLRVIVPRSTETKTTHWNATIEEVMVEVHTKR